MVGPLRVIVIDGPPLSGHHISLTLPPLATLRHIIDYYGIPEPLLPSWSGCAGIRSEGIFAGSTLIARKPT